MSVSVMLYLNEFEFWRNFNWDTMYVCELIWCAHEILMSSRNSHTIIIYFDNERTIRCSIMSYRRTPFQITVLSVEMNFSKTLYRRQNKQTHLNTMPETRLSQSGARRATVSSLDHVPFWQFVIRWLVLPLMNLCIEFGNACRIYQNKTDFVGKF